MYVCMYVCMYIYIYIYTHIYIYIYIIHTNTYTVSIVSWCFLYDSMICSTVEGSRPRPAGVHLHGGFSNVCVALVQL